MFATRLQWGSAWARDVPNGAKFAEEFEELFRSDVVGQVLYEESSVDFCMFRG